MPTEDVEPGVMSKSSQYYDRRCPRCNFVLPKGWHVNQCGKCRLQLRNKKIKITRERRCPYCNAINSQRWHEEAFCRKCLRNLSISSMQPTWFLLAR